MKELSIEDKAKAYDELIKRLNKAREDVGGYTFKSVYDEVMSELAESEDEEPKKWILEYLYDGLRKSDEQFKDHFKCAISWLEKRGEKGANGKNREIPFSEQKPVEWSEEDEEALRLCLRAIETAFYYKVDYKFQATDWLKSLKGRVQPQSKQEWSEEDKDKLNRIYSILGQAADTHAFSTTCRLIGDRECIELQDFLKFLRPQNTWKPSDEQMKALWVTFMGGEEQAALASLYNDLKKLK